MAYSVSDVTRYIREAAARRGIDPNVALRVARSEGLQPGTWQSNYVKNGRRETSYGPFQLMEGGGLGDKFAQQYGKSASDPSTVYQQVDFALDEAKKGGWGPWYGAAKVGVGNRTGLGGQEGSASMGTPSWLKYSNQGATRSQPLNPQLINKLGFLGDLGVTMDVFSGGQPSEGPNRTGSHRHDHGNSADVFFMKDGRRLDWANEADRPIFEEVVRRGKAAGISGFGAGPGYMQQGSMHLGLGSPAVWGAGGSGDNAPDWLRNAFAGKLGGDSNVARNFDPQVAGQTNTPLLGSLSGFGGSGSGAGGGGIDPIAAQLAAGQKEKNKGSVLGNIGAALDSSIPSAPGIGGGGGGFGNAGGVLATIMQNPQALAQAIMKRRMV